jgi:hypothetical protein
MISSASPFSYDFCSCAPSPTPSSFRGVRVQTKFNQFGRPHPTGPFFSRGPRADLFLRSPVLRKKLGSIHGPRIRQVIWANEIKEVLQQDVASTARAKKKESVVHGLLFPEELVHDLRCLNC